MGVQGPSPGIRAGHATVNFGTKASLNDYAHPVLDKIEKCFYVGQITSFVHDLQVYVIGGVGNKHYYNDVWVLDICSCSWNQLEICGQQPQGRFSHTAIVTDTDIAIYGG